MLQLASDLPLSTALNAKQQPPTLGNVLSAKLVCAGIQNAQYPQLWNLDIPSIENILRKYNNMATETPFCTTAALSDVVAHLEENTVFTLAAMLIAPDVDHEITKQLDFVFHRVLTDQAMVRGKQNLDLLNGLVTYLMWFHHRYDPETQQYFQYLQLAKAMVEDLRLVQCLRDYASEADRLTHVDVARILAGLCYVDRGTIILDTIRARPTMSIESARIATEIIKSSRDRPADEYACDVVRVIYQNFSSSRDFTSSGSCESPFEPNNSCNYYAIVRHFWRAWSCLHGQPMEAHNSVQSRVLCALHFANLNTVVSFVRKRSMTYLQTMTIVEWAYLLASLITIPHLEIMSGDILIGRTAEIAENIKIWLVQGQANDAQLLQRSKHLWWLHGIIKDIDSTVRTRNGITSLEELVAASPYELLEQLTERLCGFRKSVTHGQALNPQSKSTENRGEDDTWARVIAEWTNLN